MLNEFLAERLNYTPPKKKKKKKDVTKLQLNGREQFYISGLFGVGH